MRIYLAGPMRGLPDWNFAAFSAAAERWRADGHRVFSPADVAVALGYGLRPRLVYDGEPPDTPRGQPTMEEGRAHLQHVILSDVASIFASEAIALLPGWERSTGATVEVALGLFLGLRFFNAEMFVEIYPRARPWDVAGFNGEVHAASVAARGVVAGGLNPQRTTVDAKAFRAGDENDVTSGG